MQNSYIILRKGPNRDKIEPCEIQKSAMQAPGCGGGEIHRKAAQNRGLHSDTNRRIHTFAARGHVPLRGGGIIRRITWGNILEPTAFAAKPV